MTTSPPLRLESHAHTVTALCTGRWSASRRACLTTLALLVALLPAATAQAATPSVLLGTSDPFALLAGSTITNTGNSVITGELGLHPGSAVTGFPPGLVNGAQHIGDAIALQAKTDLTTAYLDAAGRASTATLAPDVGGSTLTSGVYRTGSVPSLGLTGNLTLDAQGDPRAVFIFQIESTLVTATDSSVSLINGAQSCNVFWQVGSSATLGTRTAFRGNILALTAISVNDAATVDGRLFARNAAVTLINDTVTRSTCAAGTEPIIVPGGGTGAGSGADRTGPTILITGTPGTDCIERNFTARIRVGDRAGIRSVKVYLDGALVKSTRASTSLVVKVRGLRVGSHRIRVVALDRAGNQRVTTRRFERCTLALAVPNFTG